MTVPSFYRTYQFYDVQARRLAIFGEYTGHLIKYYVFTCSRKDQFSKNTALALFEDYKSGRNLAESYPVVFTVPVLNNKPGKTFIDFLNQSFLRKHTIASVFAEEVLLDNKGNVTKINKSKVKEWKTII